MLNIPNSTTTTDRDATVRRRSAPSSPLSTSEPSLRFPRPQGNRRLANWVSKSHPDIMRTSEAPEDSSLLAESAYELIHNTDTESQDGHAPESVSSADFSRGDDVHSLAGTEQTNDDEYDDEQRSEVDADGREHVPSEVGSSDTGSHSDAASESDQTDPEEPMFSAHVPAGRPSEPTVPTASAQACSIEYAEQCLEIPSKTGPEKDPDDAHRKVPGVRGFVQCAEGSLVRCWEVLGRQPVLAAVGMVTCVLAAVFSAFMFTMNNSASSVGSRSTTIWEFPIGTPASISVSTSTVVINLTSTKTVLVSETKSATYRPALPPAQVQEKAEGRTVCSTERYSPNEILLKIPHSTKTSWLAKDSISIDVSRGEDSIKTKFSTVDEGILIEIPKGEAYGVLNVSVTTSRRPKVNETFEVDFGKGLLLEAVDMGISVAEGLASMLLDVAAQAGRLAKATTATMNSAASTRKLAEWKSWEAAVKDAQTKAQVYLGLAGQGVKNAFDEAKHQVDRDKLTVYWNRQVGDLEDRVRIGVLKAQIEANLWWLRVRGKETEHNVYARKSGEFFAKRVDAARSARRARQETQKETLRALRKKERLQARCRGQGFARWAQQCNRGV